MERMENANMSRKGFIASWEFAAGAATVLVGIPVVMWILS